MNQADPTITDRLIAAAFARIARDGWLTVSIAEIADEAGVPVGEAFAVLPSKSAVLDVLLRRVEERMLADAAPDFAEPARDRLFETVMLRFDALAPYRAGLARMLRELPADPLTALAALPGLPERLARVLEASGLSTSGPLGLLRVQGFALIYFDALRVWLDDESPDMAKTMATLDRDLRRAESVMRFADDRLPFRRTDGGVAAASESPPAAGDWAGDPTDLSSPN